MLDGNEINQSLHSIEIPRFAGSVDKSQVLARLLIAFVRVIGVSILHSKNFGSRADDALLCAAIYVGQAEGRPMTAAKLAGYAGLPRTTVVRRAALLKRQGVVSIDARGRMSLAVVTPGRPSAAAKKMERAVILAAQELTKLDTKNLA